MEKYIDISGSRFDLKELSDLKKIDFMSNFKAKQSVIILGLKFLTYLRTYVKTICGLTYAYGYFF